MRSSRWIPDLSDAQVIIYTEYPGQAPQVVEDQVTYPLSTAMLAVPKSRVVRGLSVFGASYNAARASGDVVSNATAEEAFWIMAQLQLMIGGKKEDFYLNKL